MPVSAARHALAGLAAIPLLVAATPAAAVTSAGARQTGSGFVLPAGWEAANSLRRTGVDGDGQPFDQFLPPDGAPVNLDGPPDNAITAGTAVPEPASWALLLAGFALVGTRVRRRRGAAAIG